LRGDRRGREPATRAESADAEAAGGCGRLTIVAPLLMSSQLPFTCAKQEREWRTISLSPVALRRVKGE
jgi:hypothetical protein